MEQFAWLQFETLSSKTSKEQQKAEAWKWRKPIRTNRNPPLESKLTQGSTSRSSAQTVSSLLMSFSFLLHRCTLAVYLSAGDSTLWGFVLVNEQNRGIENGGVPNLLRQFLLHCWSSSWARSRSWRRRRREWRERRDFCGRRWVLIPRRGFVFFLCGRIIKGEGEGFRKFELQRSSN